MKEQRRFPRAPQSFKAQVRNSSLVGASWRPVQSVNLGAGGMRFVSEEFYEAGSSLEIKLELPNSPTPLMVRARLTWNKSLPSGLVDNGVAFVDMTPSQQANIDALVQFLSQAGPPPA